MQYLQLFYDVKLAGKRLSMFVMDFAFSRPKACRSPVSGGEILRSVFCVQKIPTQEARHVITYRMIQLLAQRQDQKTILTRFRITSYKQSYKWSTLKIPTNSRQKLLNAIFSMTSNVGQL